MEWLFQCLAGLAGFLGLAAGIAIITVAIRGLITRFIIRRTMSDKGMQRAIVTAADRCKNIVRLKELETGQILEMQGDGIEDGIMANDIITS